MDSFERVYASFQNKYRDRPPILPHIGDHAGIINGYSFKEMYRNSTAVANAHLKALELYGYDFTTIQVEPSWPVVEACGAKITYPKDKSPWILSHAVKNENDLSKLEVPDFLESAGSKTMIEGTKILSENAGVPVVAYMTGPLTFSLQLMPYEKLIGEMMKRPTFTHSVIKKSVEIIKEYITFLKEAGATICIICEHDVQLVSPYIFKTFSLNYLGDLLDIYQYNILHLCGKVHTQLRENVSFLKDVQNLQTINIGPELDIASTQRMFHFEVGIAGNIDHRRLLPNGTSSEIQTTVHNAIEASGGDNRYMVAPGCEITVDTPIENVKALVNSVKTYRKEN